MKPLNYKIQRISRAYFWVAWVIWNALSITVLFVMSMEYQHYEEHKMNILFAIVLCIHFIYLFLLIVKRFHDAGRSTGYCAICMLLTPFVIGDLLIFLTCIKESDGDNRWGSNEELAEYERNRAYYAK